jgi:hypothetical protein
VICPLLHARPNGEARTDATTRPRAGQDTAPDDLWWKARPRQLEASMAPPLDGRRERVTAGGWEPSQTMRTAPDGVSAREMPTRDDAQAGAGRSAGLFGELEAGAGEGDGVVLADRARFFFAQDLIEVDGAERNERRGRVRRRSREEAVVLGDEVVAQIGVGGVERRDAGAPQLIDETILQRAIEALAAAAGLRRVGADVRDTEPGEGAAEVGEMVALDGAARGGRVERPAGAVGVERAREASGSAKRGRGRA